MRDVVREVTIAGNVLDFALSIVLATQPNVDNPTSNRYLRYGASPRGAQSLVTAAKIYALLDTRYNVAKEDIQRSAKQALRHRIGLSFEAEADGLTADSVLDRVIEGVSRADRDPISV
jgi:MoxR-like ATPase